MISDRPIILYIEDSETDNEATVRAFHKCKLTAHFYRCPSGDEALDYLYRRGAYSNPEKSPCPHLIILDLNLPGTDGREVLKKIKEDENLKKIPVVVLTTSDNPMDVSTCYQWGANSYIQKPVDFSELLSHIEHLKSYWFQTVVLPVAIS